MKQQTQVELIKELLELHETKTPYLDAEWVKEPLDRYFDPGFFRREQDRIFRALPQIAAHSSELPDPGSFITLEMGGKPLLLVRDHEGQARAFLNVCRHRGAQLVGESSGCKKRFSCPYHAWTWSSDGKLIGVPHEKTGFPDMDRDQFGLHTVQCEEYAGWVWVSFNADEPLDVKAHLGDLDGDIRSIDAGSHFIFESTTKDIAANWKILVEGGIEAYHFRVAHSATIAPLFLDNLSSYQTFGRHMRSILPRSSMSEMSSQSTDDWDIGKHANILYTLFPGSQFLVQEDHFVWIQSIALGPDLTRLRLATVVPTSEDTPEKEHYWRRNHSLTMQTLDEDFTLGEGIQKGLQSGANEHLNFGRFEGALATFNEFVDEAIA